MPGCLRHSPHCALASACPGCTQAARRLYCLIRQCRQRTTRRCRHAARCQPGRCTHTAGSSRSLIHSLRLCDQAFSSYPQRTLHRAVHHIPRLVLHASPCLASKACSSGSSHAQLCSWPAVHHHAGKPCNAWYPYILAMHNCTRQQQCQPLPACARLHGCLRAVAAPHIHRTFTLASQRCIAQRLTSACHRSDSIMHNRRLRHAQRTHQCEHASRSVHVTCAQLGAVRFQVPAGQPVQPRHPASTRHDPLCSCQL